MVVGNFFIWCAELFTVMSMRHLAIVIHVSAHTAFEDVELTAGVACMKGTGSLVSES